MAFTDTKEIGRFSKYIGVTTNNVAEYKAVIEALRWLGHRGPVTFHLDSELVTRQLNGSYKIKNEKLKKLAGQVKKLESQIGRVNYLHIPREKNKIADSLVNSAIDTSTL